ncbi:MAG: hypothetical protein ACFB0B_02705 [Thermonemataceae bacterium]
MLPEYNDVKATETVAYIFFAILFALSFGIGFWLRNMQKKRRNG